MDSKDVNNSGNFILRFFDILRRKTLAQIILIIIFCLFTYDKVGIEFISWSYSISLALKSILIFVLPFLILSAISTSFAKIPKGGFLFAISILIGVSLSNFINLTLAYFFWDRSHWHVW